MRVLFLTQVMPLPLDAGPKVRAYFVLRHLVQAGHEVSLLSFVRREDPPGAIDDLRKLCRSVETVPMVRSMSRELWSGFRSLATRTPFLVIRDQVKKMRQKIRVRSEARSFDAVHSDQLWMAPYALFGRKGIKTVLDQHNAVFQVPRRLAVSETNVFKRWLLWREANALVNYERQTCEQFDHVVWVSGDDLDALKRASSVNGESFSRSSIIPICVDPSVRQPVTEFSSRPRVTFLGGMHWPPNAEGIHWFIKQVWPQVVKIRPDVVLTIIGKNPPQLAPGSAPGRIETLGLVPCLARWMQETAVFIVPLLSGGGMRVKILDAWSWGLPVISTTIGAEGLRTEHGENILLLNEPGPFAQGVVDILENRALARRLRENGRATVQQHYDWRKIYRAWDSVYS